MYIETMLFKTARKTMVAMQWLRLACIRRIFPFKVVMEGGRLIMARTVRFEQKVQFQGAGTLVLEDGVVLGYGLSGSAHWPILFQPRQAEAEIRIVGKQSAVSNGCEFIARTAIFIGANCRIGPRCIFMDADFHSIAPNSRGQPGKTLPIHIGDNVWFGAEAMVLKGVKIGKDCIVGARCLVAKDIPDGSIAVGNPMKIIGTVYA